MLELALAHRSWCSENGRSESNERLEFLGDAVLGMVVADEIYARYPELPEGQLAKLRAGVVNAITLAEIARGLDLGAVLLLGKGEAATGGADKQSILADALEAVVGSVYLDGGFVAAQQLILRLWHASIADTVRLGPGGSDHKTRLQELAVALHNDTPVYAVSMSGPDHARVFEAQVRIAGHLLGEGSGSSKKEAEQAAAGIAVSALNSRQTELTTQSDSAELSERFAS